MRDVGMLLLILGVAAAFLAPLLDAGFVTDDFHLIHIANVSLDDLNGISSHDVGVFLKYFWLQASPRFELYRPSVLLTFGLNSALGGTDPWVYQMTNLCLHLLAAAVVFFLPFRLLKYAFGLHSQDTGVGHALVAAAERRLSLAGLYEVRS